jgi:hypothetical protein
MYALYSLDQLSLADETLELIDEIINEILEWFDLQTWCIYSMLDIVMLMLFRV